MKFFVLIILIATVFTEVAEAEDKIPRFEAAPCPFEDSEGHDDVQCGYLVVPENYNLPDGRSLRLAVSILKSLSDEPLSDPLVYLSGGPGGPSVTYSMQRMNSPFWTRFRKNRDLVFFDQRGTGYSNPEFCPELNFSLQTIVFRGMSLAERQAFVIEAVANCRTKMIANGIDFAFYNSNTSALDLDALRTALGFSQWNLFGISYGTRLALTAMRDTPEGIRSVIIDSTWPTNAPLADDYERLMRSLTLVFEQCAANAECHDAFPGLQQDFFAMLDDYAVNPVTLDLGDPDRFPDGQMIVDGNLLANGVFIGLYDRDFISILPLLIREIRNRNTDVLAAIADGLVKEPGFSSGLELAINCYEWRSRITSEMIKSDQSRHPELGVFQPYELTKAACDTFHKQRADDSDRLPIHSEIPTLIAAGEFDPITPPSYGRLVAATLPKSTYIEVQGEGHAATPFTPCTQGILEAFLDDPATPPETDCVAELPSAHFITEVHLNAGIYRLAKMFQRDVSLPQIAGLSLMLLLLLSAVVIWPLGWIVRRIRKLESGGTATMRKARWMAAFASALGLGFLLGLAGIVLSTAQQNPFLLAFGVPFNASVIFILPWIILLTVIGTAVFAVMSWKYRWWNWVSRLHFVLVTAACVVLAGWIFGLGLF